MALCRASSLIRENGRRSRGSNERHSLHQEWGRIQQSPDRAPVSSRSHEDWSHRNPCVLVAHGRSARRRRERHACFGEPSAPGDRRSRLSSDLYFRRSSHRWIGRMLRSAGRINLVRGRALGIAQTRDSVRAPAGWDLHRYRDYAFWASDPAGPFSCPAAHFCCSCPSSAAACAASCPSAVGEFGSSPA